MRRNFISGLFVAFLSFVSISTFAQPVTSRFQAGFDYTGSNITFRLKPDVTGTATFSTIEYFVRVPIGAPAFTWGNIVENTTNFPGMTDFFIETSSDASFRIYHFIYTAPAPITASASYTAGFSYEVFTVSTSVDPSTLNMQLVHSPTDEDPFYLAVTNGVGLDLRPVAESNFFFPSTNTGSDPFFLNLTLLTAPALFKEFNVTKQGTQDALLSWVTIQEQNVSHFILERSLSQSTGWSEVGQIKAKGNSNVPSSYSYIDKRVYDGRSANQTFFYRIRVIDIDNSEKIFPIRSIKFSATGAKEIGLYPNPARDGFTLTIPLVNPNQGKLRLNLVNRIGQVIHAREINASVASNYYYDIKTPGIINGEYMLQIVYEGEVLDTKKVIVQR